MLELWNGGEIDPAEVYARGCALDGGASRFDPEAVVPEIAALRSSFPALRFTVDGSFASAKRHVLRLLGLIPVNPWVGWNFAALDAALGARFPISV